LKLVLESVHVSRGDWSLYSTGTFSEGIHLITGDVGCGKSTLALMVAGLLRPASGTIQREGVTTAMISFQFPEYHITASSVRGECQSWGLDPNMTAAGMNLPDKLDTPPLQLSRGELKRLHLACVFAKKTDLLVLDEPFSSLDCAEKERICGKISRRSRGITIIATHEQSILPRVDYLWEIRGGQLVYIGRVPEDLSRWNHAQPVIKNLVAKGKNPENISLKDVMEASCRT
jgi:energy-coupling factor transport system ATP-binding protein